MVQLTHLVLEIKSSVAWVRLNNPQVGNAISTEMVSDFEKVFEWAESESSIKVLVLGSTGSIFCSGGDVRAMSEQTGMFAGNSVELRQNYINGIQRIPLAFEKFSKPIIGCINGAAVGAGCDLAMMCDIRVGSEKSKFGETFAKLSLISGDGGSYFLTRVIGYAKTLEMTLLADFVDSEKALAWGLLNQKVNHEVLESTCEALALKIASLPAQAVQWNKVLIRKSYSESLRSILDQAATLQGILQRTPEHFSAVDAFLKK